MPDQQMTDFEAAYFRIKSPLVAFAMRLTRDPHDAQDLLQDTLKSAWSAWSSFEPNAADPEKSTSCWFHTIMRNRFISQWRRKAHVAERTSRHRWSVISGSFGGGEASSQLEVVGQEGRPYTTTACDPRREIDERCGEAQLSERVRQALEQVPPVYREVVIGADIRGELYREIAERLGVPIGTVMSRLYRGRKILQGLLANYAREQGLENEPERAAC